MDDVGLPAEPETGLNRGFLKENEAFVVVREVLAGLRVRVRPLVRLEIDIAGDEIDLHFRAGVDDLRAFHRSHRLLPVHDDRDILEPFDLMNAIAPLADVAIFRSDDPDVVTKLDES